MKTKVKPRNHLRKVHIKIYILWRQIQIFEICDVSPEINIYTGL